MILQDLPLRGRNSIEELRRNGKVRWHGFRITYIPRKIFRVRFGNRVHTSYDTWGFFASSFESALTAWGLQPTNKIAEGKAQRGNFQRWSLKRIREYNAEELTLLQELMEKLRESVNPLELPIQSWHGPAALSAGWLRKHRARDWISDYPSEMVDPVTCGYFGGRIDAIGYGYINPVSHYDIVSAYPSAIRFLPNLTKLRWINKRQGTPPRGRLYLARIRWDIPVCRWGCLPWRSKDGTILWPMQGEGWYWSHEIEAAVDKFGESNFEFVEYWLAEGQLEYPFKSLIEEAFAYRAELKAKGHPSHVAVKLVLNSMYGKFAQTVGKATYHSPIWAGLITAQTRAELNRHITNDVVLVMTDSIWSSKPLEVPVGNHLGGWEHQDEDFLWLAEAGLYSAGNLDSDTSFTWQRGYDKTNPVDIQRLVKEWTKGDPFYEPIYKVNRFIGMGLALQTHYPWCHWLQLDRRIQPVPLVGTTKRLPLYPLEVETQHEDFVWLNPRPSNGGLSAPYSPLTLVPELVSKQQRLQDECEE